MKLKILIFMAVKTVNIMFYTTRLCGNYLKVTVWFSWRKGHWDRKEITRVSCDAKFHATTFVWCVDDWQLPFKYRMLVIIVVLAINFSYNRSTNSMPAIDTMTAFRLHVGPEMSQPKHLILLLLLFLCYNNVQNCQLYSIQLPHFKNIFVTTYCCDSEGWYFMEISAIQMKTILQN